MTVASMPSMSAMTKEMHERTREDEKERQQLHQMLVVPEEQPRDGSGQAKPQQPLIDTGPVQARWALCLAP